MGKFRDKQREKLRSSGFWKFWFTWMNLLRKNKGKK